MTHDLRARIGDVRQHRGRTEEHVVLDHGAGVDRDVVLHLDVVADDDAAGHVDVLPEATALADLRFAHDMAKVPDLRVFSDLGAAVHDRGRMREEMRSGGGYFGLYGFTVALEASLGEVE